MTELIRVLIADDHPLYRDGLTALLTDGSDTELAGAAASGTAMATRATSRGVAMARPPARTKNRRPA